jgi:hypothetical protein
MKPIIPEEEEKNKEESIDQKQIENRGVNTPADAEL